MKKLQKMFKMFLRPANYRNFLSSLLVYSDEEEVEEFWLQNSRFFPSKLKYSLKALL